MSGELQTRDKENQKVDSSEQYAINIIGDRTLQSVNLVVKESKRAVEKAMGRKPALPRPDFKQNVCPGTPRQAAAPPDVPFPKKQTQKSEKSRIKTRNSSSKIKAASKAVRRQPVQSGMRAQTIIKSLNVFKNIILSLSPGGVVP